MTRRVVVTGKKWQLRSPHRIFEVSGCDYHQPNMLLGGFQQSPVGRSCWWCGPP